MSRTEKSKDAFLSIFCDESGFTGPNLLDSNQEIFSFASVAVPNEEARDILGRIRSLHSVQMPELKAAKLLKTASGRRLIQDVLKEIDGRYSFVLNDKLLVLCGKIFEYLYEPVFQGDPSLLYRKNLHRFLAMYCYVFFRVNDNRDESREAIHQFENFMRSLDPLDAPLWFDNAALQKRPENDPFGIVLKFAQGYREEIVSDNKRLASETIDSGKWVLDISISSLWSTLHHWGASGQKLRVVCDNSKPLKVLGGEIVGGKEDPVLKLTKKMGLVHENIGFDLGEPIAFGDSRDHPSLQLADIVAGAARFCFANEIDSSLVGIQKLLERHIHPHTILPDFSVATLGTRESDVNWLVLMELAERAMRGENPHIDLELIYALAEASWAPGLFR